MSKLKTYPVDLSGTAPSNKVSGEYRAIVTNDDRIFIPTGGPFFTKSLKVWLNGTPLTKGVDFKAKELNRNGSLDSGKEVCNAIQILKAGKDFLLEYQVIGGEYTDLAEELADFIKGTPINDLTKLDWSNILNKPTVFPPSQHEHNAIDWLGYAESIGILDQTKLLAATGNGAQIESVKIFAKNKIEEWTQEYIDRYGVVITDPTPTLQGNVLLTGNAKKETPLRFNHEGLFKELDGRYFLNAINPITRIGAVSDSFLPFATGFFNVTSPLITNRFTAPAGYVEKNGDLVCLLPASDGEMIRYVYGFIRKWTTNHTLQGYRTTNQQYRPPGLAANEEIMEIMGANSDCMIGTIFTIGATGIASYKEHCIIELNGTMIQDNHSLVRVGNVLVDPISNVGYVNMSAYRPSAVKMRDGKYYIVAYAKTGSQGTLSCFVYDKTTGELNKITGWTGNKKVTTLQKINAESDRVVGTTTTRIKTGQTDIRAAAWWSTQVVDNEPFVINEQQPGGGYQIGSTQYGNDLRLFLKGDTILVSLTFQDIVTYSSPTAYIGDYRTPTGMSYEIQPDKAVYNWLRTRRDVEIAEANSVNAETGLLKASDDRRSFQYTIPYDCRGAYYSPDAYVRSTNLALGDGHVVIWTPPSVSGGAHLLQRVASMGNRYSTTEMFNGYYAYRAFLEKNKAPFETITPSTLNLENPSPIPLLVSAYPVNDGIILLHEGSHLYTGGNTFTNYYLYKPSSKVIDYRTLDSGKISGLDTSDDRILMKSNVKTRWWVGARLPSGTCQYGSTVFQSYHGFPDSSIDQTIYADVKVDYNAREFVEREAYKINAAGHSAVNFALNTAANGDLHPTFKVWTLIISPMNPQVAMLQATWASADGVKNNWLICAAKVTWNANRELVSIAIRPDEGYRTTDSPIVTYLWDINRFRIGGAAAIDYNANMTEAHWHVRLLISMGMASTNTSGSSGIRSYRMTFGADGFPRLTQYAVTGSQDGYRNIVTTPRHTGLMTDEVGMGVYRVAKPFLNWNWVSGVPWTTDKTKFFCWYTPRPTVSFKLRITEEIQVQLGGVYDSIPAMTIELSDPSYSEVIDPRNRTVFIYATLDRGKARLLITEVALAESIYNVYIGKCITDNYGIVEADLPPSTRIGNVRPSVTPQGSSFSVSSGTAADSLLLNWDADVPVLIPKPGQSNPPSDIPFLIVTGTENMGYGQTNQLKYVISNPLYAVNQIVWSSANPNIASVDNTGLVTGLNVGSATISCKINNVLSASKQVIITDSNVLINLEGADRINLSESASYQVVANPASYPVGGGVWSVSNTNLASVNGAGLVKAIRPGAFVLTYTLKGRAINKQIIADNTGISLTVMGASELFLGNKETLWYTLNYPNIQIDEVSWESTNPAIASVSDQGVVSGNALGSAVIACRINGLYAASKTIAVKAVITTTTIDLSQYGSYVSDSGYAVRRSLNLSELFRTVKGRLPNNADKVIFTLPKGFAIIGTNLATPAITVGDFPVDCDLNLNNSGLIAGMAGRGSNVDGTYTGSASAGENGGVGIKGSAIATLKIINRGGIYGGGGGGAAGRGGTTTGGGGGGVPYGEAGSGFDKYNPAGTGSLLTPGRGAHAGDNRYGGTGGELGTEGESGASYNNFGKAGYATEGLMAITNVEGGIVRGR